ncbi:MAG: chromosome partitioning protein ParB [Acidimicrobiales bacterium]|nr:MAG: chromosome partitioning protein ParB [Acidimicrobiales bacterium]
MARHSGLGRGLGALIPVETGPGRTSSLREVPVTSVRPNSHQPRSHIDEESLANLAASIRELGILQPILVRPLGDEEYELIAGERRWRAARRAGLQSVPALVQEADDKTSLEQALVENLHREDLNPLEEAAAYQQLIEEFGLTHEDVALRVGKSRAAVSNLLRLFQLPPTVQRAVSEGQLSAGHARALLGTPDRRFQEALARRAVLEGMSVRAVEDAVRVRAAKIQHSSAPTRLRPPGFVELEELLATHLDTKVKVEMTGNRGRVIIDFADLEDLERVYLAMSSGSGAAEAGVAGQQLGGGQLAGDAGEVSPGSGARESGSGASAGRSEPWRTAPGETPAAAAQWQ